LVVGFGGWTAFDRQHALGLLAEEVRLAKAAALYADDVTFASQNVMVALSALKEAAEQPDPETHLAQFLEGLDSDEQKSVADLIVGLRHDHVSSLGPVAAGMVIAQWTYNSIPSQFLPLTSPKTLEATSPENFTSEYVTFARSGQGEAALKSFEEMAEQADGNLRELARTCVDELREIRSGVVPAPIDIPKGLGLNPEGQLALGILGSLPAFPRADWDVIHDIRERLASPRLRFRAAISEAAAELKDADPEEIEEASIGLRRRVIAPALEDMQSKLDEMKAVPTLLRLTQSIPMAGAVTTNLALLVSDPAGLGLAGLMHGLASAPALAAGAREVALRRGERNQLKAQPFWLLRELQKEGSS
jgi:hypothetical protein